MIYIIVVFSSWILSLSGKLNSSIRIQRVFALVLMLFLCFGYMTGSDWRSYERTYEMNDMKYIIFSSTIEPGFYIYSLPFKYLNIEFWPFFIATKVILFVLIFMFIKKNFNVNIYSFWMLFLPFIGFFLFIDNPMRNFIAIVIFLLSFKYLINKSFFVYLGFALLAISFHFTAIIMFPVYYFANRRFKSKNIIIAFFIFSVIFSDQELIISLISYGFSAFPFIGAKVQSYFFGDIDLFGSIYSFGLLFRVILFLTIIFYRNLIESRLNHGKVVFNLAVIYMFFFRFGLTISVLSRFSMYFSLFYILAIVSVIWFIENKFRAYFSLFLLALALAISLPYLSNNKYVPYSNYLEYGVFKDYPSFDFRDQYNSRK